MEEKTRLEGKLTPGTRIRDSVVKKEVEDLVFQMLYLLGYDPLRDPDLLNTPKRVAKAWAELLDFDPGPCSTTFEDEGSYNQMVIVKDIKFVSMCSHHLLPFIGEAAVGYIPGGRVLGLSKIPRIFQAKAHGLQLQERIGRQVAEALPEVLQDDCLGVAVVIEAMHTCMCARGPRSFSPTVTRYMTGQFSNDPVIRQEFYSLLKGLGK